MRAGGRYARLPRRRNAHLVRVAHHRRLRVAEAVSKAAPDVRATDRRHAAGAHVAVLLPGRVVLIELSFERARSGEVREVVD